MKTATAPSITLAPATTSDGAPQAPGGGGDGGGEPLQALDLACRRGERHLFGGLNLTLRAGELVWLRADNGRGKTSLLRLLAGLAAPDAGEVRAGGHPVRRAAAAGCAPVYIGHANALKDDLTAAETLAFMARLHGREPRADAAHPRVRGALGRLGLAQRTDAPVRTLSQGQRRRIALARLALETAPLPWILDEPYDALDTAGIAALDALLGEHLARGGCAILTSHQALAERAPQARTVWLTRDGLESRA
jgi:heme exporter protein A